MLLYVDASIVSLDMHVILEYPEKLGNQQGVVEDDVFKGGEIRYNGIKGGNNRINRIE